MFDSKVNIIVSCSSKKHGIGIVNASPISMGLLSSRGPPSWHPAGELVRNKCKEAADYCQVCQGYVYSKPDKFENATFFIRIGLPSTLKRCFRCPKTELFENALQKGKI